MRIKYLLDAIPAKEHTLGELRSKIEKEARARTAEETQTSKTLISELTDMRAELVELQAEETRKALLVGTPAKPTAQDLTAEERAKAPAIEVTNSHKKTEEFRNVQTFKMLQASVTGNMYALDESRKELAEGGHFDDQLKGKNGEKRTFNTLVDTDGGILLPTTISGKIMDIVQEYGIIPSLATSFGNIDQGSLKIPQILGRAAFSAVGQGGAISTSGFSLGAIELKALKWGSIIPWTNEITDSVASTLMPIIMDKVAEGFAFSQDDTFFNGDGTSAYNSIKGLETLTGAVPYVRTATAPTGNVSFATLDADDFLLPQEQVAPGARSGCFYVVHPNMLFTLRKLKDGDGRYIYGDPSAVSPIGSLWGYPIRTSEAFPITDGVSKTVAAFFNPKYVAYASGRAMSVKELTEGSVMVDGVLTSLAMTDSKALRFTSLFDIVLSSVTRSTAGTAQGAFSILRTAAS